MLRRLHKGQSTAEYAIVIGLVIAAAVAMQIYIKRQLQGKVKDAVDYNETTAETNNWLKTTAAQNLKQYDPYYQTSENVTTTADNKETTETFEKGQVTRTIAAGDNKTTRGGTTSTLDYTNYRDVD